MLLLPCQIKEQNRHQERKHESRLCTRRGCSLWLTIMRDLKEARDTDTLPHFSSGLKRTFPPNSVSDNSVHILLDCASPSSGIPNFLSGMLLSCADGSSLQVRLRSPTLANILKRNELLGTSSFLVFSKPPVCEAGNRLLYLSYFQPWGFWRRQGLSRLDIYNYNPPRCFLSPSVEV